MPRISVIVPVYNSEKYLDRCIESILKQTFEDFELILVNDGSCDNSGNICDKFEENDSRVKVIHKENGGVSTARNAGIDVATGEYIMFVDSDDYISENMLKDMLEKIGGADMVISSIKMICGDKDETYIIPDNVYSSRELIESYCFEEFPLICICGPCCKLFKLQLLKLNGIRFEEDVHLGEDTCFNMEYIRNCQSIITMGNAYYFYERDNESSLFSKFRDYYYDNIKKVYERSCETAHKLECSDESLIRLRLLCQGQLVSNLRKAIATSDKKNCIAYMKKLKDSDIIFNNIQDFKNDYLKYLTLKLIQIKCYNLVYYLWKTWEDVKKIRRRKHWVK